jgi:hypothetical protein
MSTAEPTVLRLALDQLLKLQALDSQRDRITRARARLGDGAALTAASESARSEEESARSAQSQAHRSLKDAELELAALETKIKSYEERQRSGTVINAREISNVQREIGQLIKQRAALDDKILALMDETETLRLRVAKAEVSTRSAEQELTTFTMARQAKIAEFDAELARLDIERGGAVAAVTDGALLKRYETLRSRPAMNGLAVVSVTDQHCGGCHNQVSTSDSDRVREALVIVTCESCGRILASIGSSPPSA